MSRRKPEHTDADPVFVNVAARFWFAVQRMAHRGDTPPNLADIDLPGDDGDDDGSTSSGVPKRPAPSSGSASAAAVAQDDDTGSL